MKNRDGIGENGDVTHESGGFRLLTSKTTAAVWNFEWVKMCAKLIIDSIECPAS
jgi:hypothetical protein